MWLCGRRRRLQSRETFWNLDQRRDETLNAKESSCVYLYLFCVQSSSVGQNTKKIERERGPFILSEKKYVNVLCGQE